MKGELKMFGNKGKKGQREVEQDMRRDVYVEQDVRFQTGK